MVSTARSVASGSAWTYGSQLVSMVLQFGYAAITSRIVGPDAFGAYAVAVLVANLVAIISAAGLGQSIARSISSSPEAIRGLGTVALGYGAAAALFIMPLAPVWAELWGNADASSSIQLVGLSAALAPSVGLLSGLLRKNRDFKSLAVCTVSSNALALIVSAVLVAVFRTPEALIAAPALTQLFTYVSFQLATAGAAIPGRVYREILDHLSFGWKVSVANVLAYGIENVGRFAVSRAVGQTALGYWNRADVLTTVPFDRLQGAMSQALYPELGNRLSDRARMQRVWTDILVIVGWISMPASGFLAGAVPSLVPIIFGDDWNPVIGICILLAIAAGFRGSSIQLASALESVGYFGWIWATHAILLLVQVGCAIVVFQSQQILPAIVGMLLVPLLRHIFQVYLCHVNGLLFAPRLLVNYLWISVAAVCCGGISYSASMVALSMDANYLTCGLLLAVALCVIAGVAFMLRARLPILTIAKQYGFAAR